MSERFSPAPGTPPSDSARFRRFVDGDLTEWTVKEVEIPRARWPKADGSVGASGVEGRTRCLRFASASESEHRVLAPAPRDWHLSSASGLRALLRRAGRLAD